MPVISNLGELSDPLPLVMRRPQMVVYDNVGRDPRMRQRAVRLVRRACEKMGIERLVLLGLGDVSEWSATGLEVASAGVASADVASRLLSQSRAGCLEYFDGYLGKSGIFAAYCAHALVPLLVSNNHSEVDDLEVNRNFWAAECLPESAGIESQQRIASQARQWYDAHSVAATARTYAMAIEIMAC